MLGGALRSLRSRRERVLRRWLAERGRADADARHVRLDGLRRRPATALRRRPLHVRWLGWRLAYRPDRSRGSERAEQHAPAAVLDRIGTKAIRSRAGR